MDPNLIFESITFSDGTTVELGPTDVVVLVGPNNCGKSAALREIVGRISASGPSVVIGDARIHKSGSRDDFLHYFERHSQYSPERDVYWGYKYGLTARLLRRSWPDQLGSISSFFCLEIQTSSRITDSDPAPSIAFGEESSTHPIQRLYEDEELETTVSNHFRSAFGCELIVDRMGGTRIPLLVGNSPGFESGEDRISRSYRARLKSFTHPLESQGDGMRAFASVLVQLFASVTPTVTVIDEPEVFLHPPQARLIGQICAAQHSHRGQVFIATHSPDVLLGLMNESPTAVRVLRMIRDGDVNRVTELDKDRVGQIISDPLMKFSSVLSGVFHDRVVVCESYADCMFFSAILDIEEIRGEKNPDVLFIHAGGKHNMHALAEHLVSIQVPIDIIADMDIIQDLSDFERLIGSLGGDWESIAPAARAVKSAIESRTNPKSADEVSTEIHGILAEVECLQTFPTAAQNRIKRVFRDLSPWATVKRVGVADLKGEPLRTFLRLRASCKELGLWITPVGELEGFCRSVDGHGPRWVQRVIGSKNLRSDPELQFARDFMKELWQSTT